MMNGYFMSGTHETEAVFDLFFRENKSFNYCVAAGLLSAVDYIKNLRFTDSDIDYLKGLNIFGADFLDYLKSIRFTGDLYAVEEGEIVFASEPLLTVKAPVIEAQLLETALLNIVCHQTLIATKAARVVSAAGGAPVTEFGLRRAQGPDAGVYGARAAIIGGCTGTSNVLAGKLFGARVLGTHAHSWVMSFESELEAFEKFAEIYPDNCLLLVDTYDTLKSGVPNAIKVFNKLREKGRKPVGIRLDSGDLAYLSKKARIMLDEAGFNDAVIFASNDLDENLIASLALQGAKIDSYGVGTKLITSFDCPSLGGVYKMSAIKRGGKWTPCLKLSDTAAKITNPGFKTVHRVYAPDSGRAFADLIALRGEKLARPLVLTHEFERWKTATLERYDVRELPVKIFASGKSVYEFPSLAASAAKAKAESAKFWDEYKRLVNPHIYKVNISDGLYALKQELISSKKTPAGGRA
jgi:nicotinate phosphoribosyltransferase